MQKSVWAQLFLLLFWAAPLLAQDLIANVATDHSVAYSLNYQEYPGLVAAFLYIAQNEPELYGAVQFHSQNQAAYGKAFISLPDKKFYSLPNIPSARHPQPGLAFWRSGSVLRSDILVLSNATVGLRDQNNLAFFAEPLPEEKLKISRNKGLTLTGVEAQSPAAEAFLSSLETVAYSENLEQIWQDYLQTYAPEVSTLLTESEGWQRDAFGYYSRTVERGRGSLPQVGEDLSIHLARKALAGSAAQSLPVIVSFGRDVLPMPFAYFVARTPKGSHVEILCPPSAARSILSSLPAEYGGTRYQWLLDSYAGNNWVYLSFRLEL